MKAMIFNFVLLVGFIGPSFGLMKESRSTIAFQEKQNKVIEYKAWLTTMDGEELKGILVFANEYEILISDGFRPKRKELIQIPFQDIREIKLQRKGSFLKGGIVGGVVGVGLAFLVTKDVKDKPSSFFVSAVSREKVVKKAVTHYAITGTRIGSKLADEKAHFMFMGNKIAYKNQLKYLKEYCSIDELLKLESE